MRDNEVKNYEYIYGQYQPKGQTENRRFIVIILGQNRQCFELFPAPQNLDLTPSLTCYPGPGACPGRFQAGLAQPDRC